MIARAYIYIRWLSLDIVAGAIFVSLFLSSQLGVALSAIEMALLGLAVWLIYTTDHLLDVRKRTVVTARRMVYQRHPRLFTGLILLAALASAALLPWLNEKVLLMGSVLAACAAMYLFAAKHLGGTKEVFGALFYSAGILLVSFVRADAEAVLPVWLPLFLLAYLNLLILSVLDKAADEQEGFNSLAGHYGEPFAKRLIWLVVVLLLLACAGLYHVHASRNLLFFFGAVTLVHVALFRLAWFHAHERYRILGDMAFWVGGVVMAVTA